MTEQIQAVAATTGSATSTVVRPFGAPARADAPSPAAAPAARSTPPPSTQSQAKPAASNGETERLRAAMKEIERKLADSRTDLQFRVDDDLHELIVSVVNSKDGSVLRQFPSEVALRIARLLSDEPGALIDSVA
jgi:flagellar protein FlaG